MASQFKQKSSMGRNLFLTKIPKDKISHYQRHVNDLFSDPKKYFMTDLNNTKVLIGNHNQKITCNIISSISSQLKPKKNSQSRSSRSKSRRSNDVVYYNLYIGTFLLKNINNNSFDFKPHQLPPNKYYVKENEVSSIYQRFQEIKERNASMKNSNHRNASRNLEDAMSLTCQQNALEKYSQYEKENKKMANVIAKKSKKNEHNLLIKNISAFRIKKEQRDKISDEMKKKHEGSSPYSWMLNLKSKNENHYIYSGTKNNPKWHIVLKSKNNSEIIRDPKEYEEEKEEDKHKPILTRTKSIKHKLLTSSLSDYNRTETASKFKGLHIIGNDLLKLEYNSFKNMRNRIIITKSPKSEENIENERVFIRHYDPKDKSLFG